MNSKSFKNKFKKKKSSFCIISLLYPHFPLLFSQQPNSNPIKKETLRNKLGGFIFYFLFFKEKIAGVPEQSCCHSLS